MKQKYWRSILKTGSLCSLLIVILIPIQMGFFIIHPHPTTIEGWFTLYKDNPVLGFIGMDLLYMVSNLLLLGLFTAMFTALKNSDPVRSVLAFGLALFSLSIFFSSNRSMEMFYLSQKYFATDSVIHQERFLAAGEMAIAVFKGTAFSVYYILNGIALLIFFTAMKSNSNFRTLTQRAGFISALFMLIPPTFGIVGMTFSLLSLIPWMLFSVAVFGDLRNYSMKTGSQLTANPYKRNSNE